MSTRGSERNSAKNRRTAGVVGASGVPVVAAREGGAGELIRETGGGLTYGANDVSEMIDTLETVLTNPTLQVELGAKGQAYVQREYTAPAMAKRWLEYLQA